MYMYIIPPTSLIITIDLNFDMHVYHTEQLNSNFSKTCVCLYILSMSVGVICTQFKHSLRAHMSIVMSIIRTLDECLGTKP